MIIKSITIGGFKNLQKTKIDLEKIIALVSPNNYGKSNLLEAIEFGINFLTASSKQRKSMMAWTKAIPLSPKLAYEDFFFDIELDIPELDDYRFVDYGFTFSWIRDAGNGQKITDEWINTRKSESVRYSALLKRPEGKYRKGYSTNAFRKILLDDSQLAIDVMASFEDIEILSVINSLQDIKYRVCSSIDLQDRYTPMPFELIDNQDDSYNIFDDADIPRALFMLKKNHPDKFNLFQDAVFTLFPEFTSISVQTFELKDDSPHHFNIRVSEAAPNDSDDSNKEIPFKIKEEMFRLVIKSEYLNQPINASLMSTGTQRVIWLLANIFIASCTDISLIGVEELEASIHPRLIKNLLEILLESQENTRLIITSHSPLLIQYLKLSQIYVGLPDDGTAQFKRIMDSKMKTIVKASRNLEVAPGEYLFELMSGSSDSAQLLEQLLAGPTSE